MRLLLVHNKYLKPGGEDIVVNLEKQLLESNGVQVELFSGSNDQIDVNGLSGKIKAGANTLWSRHYYRKIAAAIDAFKPDLIHVHNTFPLMSPSIYWAASSLGVPVVQTLHNYRLTCTNGLLLRDNHPCELCVGRPPLPALRYRCYRDSRSATAVVAGLQVMHRLISTYAEKIDHFIALTQFARSVFLRAGLPASRIGVKPNFIPDPLQGKPPLPPNERENTVVFVGRVAFEKGVDLLLDAWPMTRQAGWKLIVIGDGPDKDALAAQSGSLPDVVWRGWLDRQEVLNVMARARYLVMPSRWYEGFPMVLLEALACGTPVLAPRHGGFPEIIRDRINGMLFEPNSSQAVAAALAQAIHADAGHWTAMSRSARQHYQEKYSPDVGYANLIHIYNSVSRTASIDQ
ncbi:MAG: glycosyltransferase family 4 protein [Pseudomonadota bacterium]|nr:glycosyltransferase family 4 protein [Pseudomonadota bacterium]